MSRTDVTVPSPEGDIRAFAFKPDTGAGPWPTVLFVMDGLAIRPALFEMGERLASNGYYVLLPDMFWRVGPYPPMDVKAVLSDEAKRRELFGRFLPSTNPERCVADVAACLAWLDQQPQARAGKLGVIGYCMGGAISFRAAAAFPDRFAAIGAFHAGAMVTDKPDSAHLLAPKLKAQVLVAGADQDAGFTPEACAALDAALKAAGVPARVSIWPGALHGYAPKDTPTYNEAAAERHWREMVGLFRGTIG